MRIKQTNISDYLVILNLVLLSGSVYVVGFANLCFIVSFFILGISFFCKKFSQIELRVALEFFSYTLIILCLNFFLSISDTIPQYITFLLRLVLGMLSLLCLYKIKFLDHIILQILFVVAIVSLGGFLLSQFQIGTKIRFDDGYETYNIFWLHFYYAVVFFGKIHIIRNQGIFWEPGVLAVFMNIGLLLSLQKYQNIKKPLFFSFIVITTFSTAGFIIMLLQWAIFLWESRKISSVNKILLGLLILIPLSFMSYHSFIQKKEDRNLTSSFSLRMLDLQSSFQVVISHPLVGVGLNMNTLNTELYTKLPEKFKAINVLKSRGNSNSIANLFMMFGIPVALLVLFLLYRQTIITGNRSFVFILLFLCLMSEPLIYSPFFIFLMYAGYRSCRIKNTA